MHVENILNYTLLLNTSHSFSSVRGTLLTWSFYPCLIKHSCFDHLTRTKSICNFLHLIYLSKIKLWVILQKKLIFIFVYVCSRCHTDPGVNWAHFAEQANDWLSRKDKRLQRRKSLYQWVCRLLPRDSDGKGGSLRGGAWLYCPDVRPWASLSF